jgi:YcaO-like protein with predicted kinase domain
VPPGTRAAPPVRADEAGAAGPPGRLGRADEAAGPPPGRLGRPARPAAGELLDLGSSRRWVRPEQTLARAEALFGLTGITRLACITGLDRIGIPVWLAIRPNGRSLSGGQGKGITDAAAQASAVMESIETWHAERLPAGETASFAALGPARALDPAALDPGPDRDRWQPAAELAWLAGRDLLTGAEILVPRQSLDVDLTCLAGPRFLAGSTNGLASGNRRDEAILHGLYELVEREAERRWRLRPPAGRAATAVDLAGLAAAMPTAGELLAQIRAADCDVAVFNLTGLAGLPVYRCVIADRVREYRPAGCSGVGAHGLAAVAMLRAITEAAQSRATVIAGSRDDRYPGAYADSARQVRQRAAPPPPPPACSFTAGVRELAAPGPGAETAALLDRLAGLGVRRVAAVDLTRPGTGLAVTRVAAEGFLLPGGYGR